MFRHIFPEQWSQSSFMLKDVLILYYQGITYSIVLYHILISVYILDTLYYQGFLRFFVIFCCWNDKKRDQSRKIGLMCQYQINLLRFSTSSIPAIVRKDIPRIVKIRVPGPPVDGRLTAVCGVLIICSPSLASVFVTEIVPDESA